MPALRTAGAEAAPAPAPPPQRSDRSPRAGRPTPSRAAAIDGLICQSARRLFLDPGFAATTMDDIAAAAGVSKGTLYARYPGKDALLETVVRDLLEDLHLRSSATNAQLPADLGARVRFYARKLVETFGWVEYGQLNRLMLAAAASHPALVRDWHDVTARGYVALIARQLESATGFAPRPATDWDALASLLLYGISGWHRNALATGTFTSERFEAYCATVADTIVAGASRPRDRSTVS